MTPDRTSDVIVDRVRTLIRRGSLKPGDRLPSERALCRRFGVSRVTVREALRRLEVDGLLHIHVGAGGGAVVTTPDGQRVGAGLADLMSLTSLTPGDVTETRFVIEVGLLPLILERATEADIAALTALCVAQREAVDEGRYSTELSAEFHVRLAGCAHNAAVKTLIQTLHAPLLASLDVAATVTPDSGRRGAEEHLALVGAITARDMPAATEILRTHLARAAWRVADR